MPTISYDTQRCWPHKVRFQGQEVAFVIATTSIRTRCPAADRGRYEPHQPSQRSQALDAMPVDP